MSSRRGSTKSFASGSTTKGKNPDDARVEQLTQGVQDVGIDSQQQDDGKWEVFSKKGNKNKAGSSTGKQWAPQALNPKTRGQQEGIQKAGDRYNNGSGHGSATWAAKSADPKRPAGRGNFRAPSLAGSSEDGYRPPQAPIAPPLAHGWNWQSRPGSQQPRDTKYPRGVDGGEADNDDEVNDNDDDGDNSDDLDYSDDDELLSDEFDSDTSEKSHSALKKSKWFAKFFKIIDELRIEEVNDPERQWHCPACQGGPGAIDWYQGLQPLMTHAKTKGGKRMKLHRKLAELLEEELARKGTSVIPPGESFGRWKGLQDEIKDHQIVWPPMVVVMNTQLEQDDHDKWIGMGNQELLEYFSSYNPTRARHSYGPQGHRGRSVLIFEASARGYLDAERLHKNFVAQGADRFAWDNRRILFYHGGKRILYGFLAKKEDMDVFNQHSQGKSKLKFELRSYHEMVVNQIRQMSEDNQQLGWYKDKFVKEKRVSKALQESLGQAGQNLHQKDQEIRIIREMTKKQTEESREATIWLEQFYKDKALLHESRAENEENFEKLQQEEREKVKHSGSETLNAKQSGQRAVEVSQFIELQDREMEDYAAQREILMKAHEEKIEALRKRYYDEEVALELELNANLVRLKEKYSPLQAKDSVA